MPESFILRPVGIVISDYTDTNMAPGAAATATIEVYPEYEKALQRISEHSHLWILSLDMFRGAYCA